MRFEIGPGGGFAIGIGLVGLSAAVFFLGMVSGREITQSEATQQTQLATVYPLPPAAAASPPAAVSSKSSSQESSANPPGPAPGSETANTGASGESPGLFRPEAAATMPPAAKPRKVASTQHPKPANPAASATAGESASGAESASLGGESAAPPTPAPAHPFNIVIDAAMDFTGANRMAARLTELGYQPHITPTQINGQTWYKVQVGPYSSAADARAAQDQLRQDYQARFASPSAPPN
ncbi:MAG TPA: SPOR domain-containing protein [Candidatus Binataceae bacterium]|nr:SPOR domain-containing protein [Candidatus Binataceae bacterium]